jgi:hypothetical protein
MNIYEKPPQGVTLLSVARIVFEKRRHSPTSIRPVAVDAGDNLPQRKHGLKSVVL